MTKQEAYDTICAGLAKQKRRSADETGKCLYRGPNGLKCAVGQLIPDELYDPRMDCDTGVIDILERANIPQSLGDLLNELQLAHDLHSALADELRSRFRTTAETYGITPGAEEAITEWS